MESVYFGGNQITPPSQADVSQKLCRLDFGIGWVTGYIKSRLLSDECEKKKIEKVKEKNRKCELESKCSL